MHPAKPLSPDIRTKGKAMAKKLTNIVIDAFKCGKYPQLKDMLPNGNFTPKELAEVVESYDPKLHEAPITIGHVSDYKRPSAIPAFGWVGKALMVGNNLKLVASEFSEDLKKWCDEGLYKKVSVSFFAPDDETNPTPGKWHLHHLAFLGAAPPAVKGLESIAFEGSMTKIVNVEFAQMNREKLEDAANKDTFAEIENEFTQCTGKIKTILESEEDDDDAKKSKMYLAVSDCYYSIQGIMSLHFAFLEKGESIMEKIQSKFSNLVEKLTNKIQVEQSPGKENVDMTSEQQQARILELEAETKKLKDAETLRLAEFAETEKRNKKAKVTKLVADFVAKKVSEGYSAQLLKDMNVESILTALAENETPVELAEGKKATVVELFEGFFSKIPKAPTTPTNDAGLAELAEVAEMTNVGGHAVIDTKLKLVQFADKYAKDHRAEFSANLDHEQVRGLVIQGIINGKIKVPKAP